MSRVRGFTHLELLLVLAVGGASVAVAIPAMNNAAARNRVFTASELLAAQLRDARLAAITKNQRFQIRFNCPANGTIRMLAWTGDPAIDAAGDRCVQTLPNDGPPLVLPPNVQFGGDTPLTIEVSARGQFSVAGATMPRMLTVRYGNFARVVAVTATGRVRTS